jgi:hypothetical protein
MSPPFVFHCRMDAHDGKECKEREGGREVVEMELEERGTLMDLLAQNNYEEPEARGTCNFLLGRANNEAVADQDGKEYKE